MKKKNELDDDDDLFAIENFFTQEKPIVRPQTQANNATPKVPQQGNAQSVHVTRIKSSEIPGVSIKKILNDDGKDKEQVVTTQYENKACNEFTQKDLIKVWNEYIATVPEKKILTTTMSSYKPKLTDDFFIELSVDNPIQEREVLNERPSLLAFLQKKLNNGKIRMSIRIMQIEENKKMLSPKDRLKGMVERNENMKKLMQELALELD